MTKKPLIHGVVFQLRPDAITTGFSERPWRSHPVRPGIGRGFNAKFLEQVQQRSGVPTLCLDNIHKRTNFAKACNDLPVGRACPELVVQCLA